MRLHIFYSMIKNPLSAPLDREKGKKKRERGYDLTEDFIKNKSQCNDQYF